MTSPFSPRILVAEEYSWCIETYLGLGSRFGIGKSLYHPIIKALPNNCECELWRWDKSLSLHNSRTPLVPQWPWREKDGWSSMEIGEPINVMWMKDYSWQQRTLGSCSYSRQSLNFVLSNIQPTTPVIWKQIMIHVYVNLIIVGMGHFSLGKSFKLVGSLMHLELGMGSSSVQFWVIICEII